MVYIHIRDFSGGLDGKESAYNPGDLGSILGLGDPLEKEMATHSSILAWKIPWTEEPGRLYYMGLQRVGHDLAAKPPPQTVSITENDCRKEQHLYSKVCKEGDMQK